MTQKTRHPKPTLQQNAGRTLRRAAQLISDRGWLQGAIGDCERGFCALGAIDYIDNNVPQHRRWTRTVFGTWLRAHRPAHLFQTHWDPNTIILKFNDARATKVDDVIAAMWECADELDPQ